jgi:hypothetical protein
MNFSDFLSVFAVIISSVSLMLSWKQFSRDTGYLKLSLDFSVPPVGGALHLAITNIGRRPITVRNIYLCARRNERFLLSESNILLEETESREITIPISGYVEKTPLEVKFIEVIDTRGKQCKISTFWLKWKMNRYSYEYS